MPLNVFITGASSGIGEALARAYAEDGATLGLVARRKSLLDGFLAQERIPGRAYQVDVTQSQVLRDAAQLHLREFGCPDIVIANAGVSAGTLTERHEDLSVFARIVDTNLIATVATFEPFIAAMKARGGGTLVAISSVAGVRGLPGAGAYSASKAAVTTYCESLRIELRKSGIRVVTIAPGYIDTPMTRANRYPMPFLMAPDAFARRALRAIERGDRYRVIPWPMAWIATLLRLMPRPLYDRVFALAPRKARGTIATSALDEYAARSNPTTSTGELFDTFDPSTRHAGMAPWVDTVVPVAQAEVDDRPRAEVKTWRERLTWPTRKEM